MPKSGYRAITIPDHLAELLTEKAKNSKTSVPKQIEYMVMKQYPHLKPVKCQCGYITHINTKKQGEKKCRNCGGVIA